MMLNNQERTHTFNEAVKVLLEKLDEAESSIKEEGTIPAEDLKRELGIETISEF